MTLVGLLITQFNVIATNQHYTKFVGKEEMASLTSTINNKDDIMIEYDDANEQTLFSAKPVLIDDEATDKQFEEILETAYKAAPTEPPPPIPIHESEERIDEPLKSPLSVDTSYISTSSLEDSIKIYNVQTGEIMKCKPDNLSPSYENNTNDNIGIVDKSISEPDSASPTDGVHEDTLTAEPEVTKSELFESDDILLHLPKVKELAKKFGTMEHLEESTKMPQLATRRRKSKENLLTEFKPEKNKQMYMHSLTARSISKEFREELKLSMSTPLTVPGGAKEIPEGIEEVTKESSRPGSPLPEPGTIKTKLAFFESLKTKFSSK